MSYVSLISLMEEAKKNNYAVGAFNIFNYVSIHAVIAECEESRSPLILQTSVKTVKQLGIKEMARIIIPMAEAAGVPVALHLDHCKELDIAKQCADAGWSGIMYDGSALPFEENLKNTKEIVSYVKGRDISVEGELGAIVGVEEDVFVNEDEASLADVGLSIQYTEETGIEAFAPAIGTAHGVYKGEPKIDFNRFEEIESSVKPLLVVHGGTGLSAEVFKKLIGMGAAKVNVSTALKVAYIGAMQNCGQFSEPLKADTYIETQIRQTIREHIEIFGSVGKA